MKTPVRCRWANSHEDLVPYHDHEWGVPVHDDRKLFEMLNLEGAQAGLSWLTILRKRENYRRAFDNFDAAAISRYDRRKMNALLHDPGIVRNALKVAAVVDNARAFLAVREASRSFDEYIWSFAPGGPITNRWKTVLEVPVTSSVSEAMSRDMKKRGFRFVGPTICYAFMQAVGIVNDHTLNCFTRRISRA